MPGENKEVNITKGRRGEAYPRNSVGVERKNPPNVAHLGIWTFILVRNYSGSLIIEYN